MRGGDFNYASPVLSTDNSRRVPPETSFSLFLYRHMKATECSSHTHKKKKEEVVLAAIRRGRRTSPIATAKGTPSELSQNNRGTPKDPK
jgi:hypothetical protein